MEKFIKDEKSNKDLVKIDGLGRVYVPLKKREKLQIKTGNKLEVYRSGRNIILKKINMQEEKNTIYKTNIIMNQRTRISITINSPICDTEENANLKHKIRTIDELGRIIIPIEERQELNIKENDKFKLCLKEDMIILIKKERKSKNDRRCYTYSNK